MILMALIVLFLGDIVDSQTSENAMLSRFTSSKCVGQFDCGEKCIPLHKFRDCMTDCEDESDEECWGDMVKCDGCRCVDPADAPALCNDISGFGRKLCRSSLTSRRTIYTCANSNCVLFKWISDNSNDCGDWSDEDACANGLASCPAGTQCRYQIPNRIFCECPAGFTLEGASCVPSPTFNTSDVPTPVTFDPIPTAQCPTDIDGTGRSLAVVIDCSESMQSDVDELVVALSTVLIPFVQARPTTISKYVLVAVKEGVGEVTETTSPLRLLQSLQQLILGGGSQCSRTLLPAVRQAIAFSETQGTLVLLTDAQIANPLLVNSVIGDIVTKRIQVHAIVSGVCAVPSIASLTALQSIVNVGNGFTFRISKSQNHYRNSMHVIMKSMEPGYGVLRHRVVSHSPSNFVVTVDDTMVALGVVATGIGPEVAVEADADWTSVSMPFVLSKWHHSEMSPSERNVAIKGSQPPFSLTIFGIGGPNFNVKFTVNINSGAASLSDLPWFGPQIYILLGMAEVSAEFTVDEMLILLPNNDVDVTAKLSSTSNYPGFQYIAGPFKVACQAFNILIRGKTPCGNTYERVSRTKFISKETDISQRIPGSCGAGNFECGIQECVSAQLMRDGNADCRSGIDEVLAKTETNCALASQGTASPPLQDDPSWCLKEGMFNCDNGVQCIPESWVGDNVDDCGDGSDENQPRQTTSTTPPDINVYNPPPDDPPTDIDLFDRIWAGSCTPDDGGYMFQCTDGTCISMNAFRDCKAHCRDASDEVCLFGLTKCGDCSCALPSDASLDQCTNRDVAQVCNREEMYPCRSGEMCVLIKDLLDGITHCSDASDEDSGYLDECYLGIHTCSEHAVCTNVPGGTYQCVCMFGYHGNGRICETPHGTSNRGKVTGPIIQPDRGNLKAEKPS